MASLNFKPAVARHHLSLQTGLGSTIGYLGAAWAYALHDNLRIETGLGLGATGLQLSIMPMVAIGSGRTRFVSGAGLSAGLFVHGCQGQAGCYWFNLGALGCEHVFESGRSVLLSAGITMPFQSVGGGRGSLYYWAPYEILPQLKIGMGWWNGPLARGTGANPGETKGARIRVSLETMLDGYGSTTGVTIAYAVSERARIDVGAAYASPGLQLSLLPSLAFGSARNRFVIAGGFSARFFKNREPRSDDVYTVERHWRNHCPAGACISMDLYPLGYEHIFPGGLTVSAALGVMGDFGDYMRNWDVIPQMKLGLGWWF